MATIGIIGSGNIGGTVARLAVTAGHEVVVSNSRGPETLADLVGKLGAQATAATAEEAAKVGDLVLVSVPLKAYPALPASALAGKLVMDTGNYYPDRDGDIAELQAGTLTESGYLGRHLGGARLVKVFNNIFFKHLLHLAGGEERTFLPIAGDGEDDKATVITLLGEIGYGALDVGPLAESWRQQPGTPVYGTPYGSFDDEHGHAAGEDTIRAAIAAATRSPD